MHRNIAVLAWFNFFIDFLFYAPIAVLYFAAVSGSYALGMSIFSAVQISAAIFEVPTGMFSDLIGRRNTVIAGALSSVFSVVCYALGGSYWMLFAGALLEGLGRAFYSGNNDALLHDTLAETNDQHVYNRYFGKLNAFNALGSAVVAVSGSIMATISFSFVMWISLIPRLVLLVLSFLLIEPKVEREKNTNVYAHLGESLAQFRQNRKLRLLTVVAAMRNAVYEGAYTFRTAFVATLWPLWAVGISNVISNLGAALSFYFSEKILDRYGYKKVLVFEIIINRIVNLSALIFPTVISPGVMGLTSLTYGVTTTAVSDMLQKEFTTKQRATLGSLSSFFGSILFGIAVIFLGYVGDHWGPANALIIAHVSILLILFVYQQIFSERKTI